jgi:hypothetical protein
MNKLQYCGSASERFRLFVMVLFQPWKRAIFKPTLSMSLSLGKVSMVERLWAGRMTFDFPLSISVFPKER